VDVNSIALQSGFPRDIVSVANEQSENVPMDLDCDSEIATDASNLDLRE
jgi:hypothetical protein